MPLINLQTNLKSFRYGHDRPGGGDSGQPFITTDINTGATSVTVGSRNILRLFGIREIPGIPSLNALLNRNRTGGTVGEALNNDQLIRGGILGAAQASLNDTLRIGAFFLSAPRGPIFIAKQVGLQLSNPKLEVKQGLRGAASGIFNPGGLLGTLTGGILGPTRLYNLGINTIAQVPVNAFGIHFNRHGITPIQSDDTKYEAVVTFNNNSPNSRQNRLIELTNKFKLGDKEYERTRGSFSSQRDAARQEYLKKKQSVARANRQGRQQARQQIQFRQNLAANAIPFLPQPAPLSPLQPTSQQQSAAIGASVLNAAGINALPPSNFSTDIEFVPLKKPTRPRFTRADRAANTVDSYLGGPGSVYGVGFTIIDRYSFTEDDIKYNEAIANAANNAGKGLDLSGQRQPITNKDIISNAVPALTKKNVISDYTGVETDPIKIAEGMVLGVVGDYATLINQIANQQRTNYDIADVTRNGIGTVINSQVSSSGFSSVNTGKVTYTNTYGETVTIGVSGSSWNSLSRSVRVGSGRRDSINLTPLFKTSIGEDNSVVTIGGVSYTINDLVKFRIEAIDTDDPSQSVFMVFRAYLTNLSDGVDASWNDIKYAGRGESFYVYNGFSRKIQVGFKVAALSAGEMEPMYQKLNYLMSNLMPDYKDNIMRGPLVRMTIGNWIDSQPGILNSISYTIPQDSPWEIALNEPITVNGTTKKELILPHVVEVSLTFTPIGSQTNKANLKPEKVKDNNVSHIAQNYNGDNPNEYNYISGPIAVTGSTFVAGGTRLPY